MALMKERAFSAETTELLFIPFGAMSQKVAVRTAATMECPGIIRGEKGASEEEGNYEWQCVEGKGAETCNCNLLRNN